MVNGIIFDWIGVLSAGSLGRNMITYYEKTINEVQRSIKNIFTKEVNGLCYEDLFTGLIEETEEPTFRISSIKDIFEVLK